MRKERTNPEGLTAKSIRKPPAGRAGRPPRERAGEVDARILSAAHTVFKHKGLAGASMDEIARLAPVSKPTLYARFSSKEELFSSVLVHKANGWIAQFKRFSSDAATLEERIIQLGTAIGEDMLVEDTVILLRLAISEAERFPDLAANVGLMTRTRFVEPVARHLAETVQTSDFGAAGAFAPDRLLSTARLFLDLTIVPLLLRALLGQKLETIRAEIGPRVRSCAPIFLMACREPIGRWHDDWIGA
ncbi:MAG: TetR/AcrR family transcriptional regulator [Rhodomicrobium sp.]